MKAAILAASFCLAGPALAQFTIEGSDETIKLTPERKDITTETRASASSAEIAELRGLDKLAGASRSIILNVGEPFKFGYLVIELQDCRYPKDNPTGDAYVHLTIREREATEAVFDGWMIASSPALMALDHPRYDVWAIRCKLDNRTPEVVAGESSPRPLMRPEGLGGN